MTMFRKHGDSRGYQPYRHISVLVGLIATLGAASTAGAQNRVVESVIVNQNTTIERFSPPTLGGSVGVDIIPLTNRIPPEIAGRKSVFVRNIDIVGATLFPGDSFAPLWAELVGRDVPVSALYDLTSRIEAQYRQAGYFAMAVVPVQELSSGTIQIRVFDQSYLQTVTTSSDYPRIRERLSPYIDQLIAMKPLRIAEVERVLLVMSDLAGMNINAIVRRPEVSGTGGALELEIDFERASGQIMADNRGTDEVGPYEVFASFQLNDMLGLFESTTVTGATIPNEPQELLFGQIVQDVPVGSQGLHAGYRAGLSKSKPGGDLSDLDIEVQSVTGELYAAYPVVRTIDQTIIVGGALNGRNTDVDVGPNAASRDRYRWLSASVDADQAFSFGALSVQSGYMHGIGAFGATREGAPEASRAIAETNFQIITGSATMATDLLDNVSLLGRATGQHAFGPLPSVVQMSFGGDPFGRAFDSGEVSGDSGIAGSLELALDTDIPWDAVRSSAVYGFVDYGALWFRGNDTPNRKNTLGSSGVGFRASLSSGFALNAVVAVPYKYAPDSEGDEAGTRFFLSLMKRF